MNNPNFATVVASPALAGMRAVNQWFAYRLTPDPERPGKYKKHPARALDGHWPVSPLEPANWAPCEAVVSCVDRLNAARPAGADFYYVPGFAITKAAGYWFLDIDGALTPEGWNADAVALCTALSGAAVEVSSSGAGLHVFGRGAVPPHSNRSGTLEFYTDARGVAVTGTGLMGDCNADLSGAIASVVYQRFNAGPAGGRVDMTAWTDAPRPEWKKPWTDAQFMEAFANPVQRTSPARAFGLDPKPDLATMWNGDPDEVAKAYGGDRSRARQGLINILMRHSGGNCEQVFRLCQGHPLAEKDGRENLLRHEILRGYVSFIEYFEPQWEREAAQKQEARDIGEGLGESIEPTVIPLEEMPARLVYVTQGRGVVDTLDGRALSWTDAIGAFAASTYETTNEKGKSKSHPSLLAWLSDVKRKTVDTLTWGPGRADFCTPPEPVQGRTRAYNTWKGLRPYEAPQDWEQRVRPFLEHIAYLVPNAPQRERFMQWLAHIVQCPGELPHTGYLMIANTTGVGRNWLSAILARVLAGHMASGVALGPLLDGKFNGRLSGKLLATVDETREGLSDNRYTRAEALKRTVTEEFRMIDHKYGMQVVEFNCCRWLMYSNHSDALPLDKMDRRIEVIDNPDWVRDADYYSRLYQLRNDSQFVASVRHWMQTLDLSTFNPGAHASMSAAKLKAVAAVTPDLDRALEAFSAEWGGPFAPRSVIEEFVKDYTGDPMVRRGALDHGMKRMNWSVWDQRMMVGNRKVRPVSLDPMVRQAEMVEIGAKAIQENMELQNMEWLKKSGFGA